jgi:hypothetical protein
MQTNPYITVTGSVTKSNTEDHSFTMTPTQYVILTHTNAPFPIHAHFADGASKKRWGPDGPKVAIGSTITIGGSLQRVVREHNIDKPLQFAQVEVANIAYLGSTRSTLTTSFEDGSPKTRKRWNWDDLKKPSHNSQASPSSSQTQTQGKRKRDDNDHDSEEEQSKREQTIDDTLHKNSQ